MALHRNTHNIVNDSCDGGVTSKAYLLGYDTRYHNAVVQHRRAIVACLATKLLLGKAEGIIDHRLCLCGELRGDVCSKVSISI